MKKLNLTTTVLAGMLVAMAPMTAFAQSANDNIEKSTANNDLDNETLFEGAEPFAGMGGMEGSDVLIINRYDETLGTDVREIYSVDADGNRELIARSQAS